MVTKYQTGTRLEYIARDKLRNAGFIVVRSAGSKGPLDLVAWREDDLRFIQCKRTQIMEITSNRIETLFKNDLLKMRFLTKPTIATLQLWISSPGTGLKIYNILKNGIFPSLETF